MNVITQFNEYSALIQCGSGYGETSRVDRDKLIELLNRLPAGDVILSTAPHQDGRAVLVKGEADSQNWYVLTPTIPIDRVRSIYHSMLRRVGL